MKKGKYLIIAGPLIVSLIISIAFLPVPISSAEVWRDNFNDGNYNGWTVRNGTFSCVNYVLNGTADSTPIGATYDCFDNEIWINSTVSHGTWSFDLHFGGQSWYGPAFWFACDVILEGEWVGTGWPGGKGLLVQRESRVTPINENGWWFAGVDGDNGYMEGHWPAPNDLTGFGVLSHVNLTFNEDGEFNMWINGTHIGTANSFLEFESKNVLIALNAGSWIDNIVVSNTIDIPPPGPTNTTTTDTTTNSEPTTPPPPVEIPLEFLAIGGGIAVLVIVLVVWRVRAK